MSEQRDQPNRESRLRPGRVHALRLTAIATWFTAGFLPALLTLGYPATSLALVLMLLAGTVFCLAKCGWTERRPGSTHAHRPGSDARRPSAEPGSRSRSTTGERIRLERARDALLSNVSHEMRTPLTSIIAATEILRHFSEEDPSVRLEFLDMIDKEAHRLLESIGSFLRLAELEAEEVTLELENVDLRTIVDEAIRASVDRVETALHRPIVRDVPDTPVVVRCDRAWTLEVLSRLIDNAAKFAQPTHDEKRGLIEIQLERVGDTAVLHVLDDGPGVPKEQRARLFHRFGKATDLDEVLTDKPRGVGLGLPICARILEAHGGTIRYRDRDYRGSCFTISLPVAASDLPTETTPALQGSSRT